MTLARSQTCCVAGLLFACTVGHHPGRFLENLSSGAETQDLLIIMTLACVCDTKNTHFCSCPWALGGLHYKLDGDGTSPRGKEPSALASRPFASFLLRTCDETCSPFRRPNDRRGPDDSNVVVAVPPSRPARVAVRLVGRVSNLCSENITRTCVRHCAPDPAVDRWRSGASQQEILEVQYHVHTSYRENVAAERSSLACGSEGQRTVLTVRSPKLSYAGNCICHQ